MLHAPGWINLVLQSTSFTGAFRGVARDALLDIRSLRGRVVSILFVVRPTRKRGELRHDTRPSCTSLFDVTGSRVSRIQICMYLEIQRSFAINNWARVGHLRKSAQHQQPIPSLDDPNCHSYCALRTWDRVEQQATQRCNRSSFPKSLFSLRALMVDDQTCMHTCEQQQIGPLR